MSVVFSGLGKQVHLSRSRGWVDVHLMWQDLEKKGFSVSVRCVHVHSFRAAVICGCCLGNSLAEMCPWSEKIDGKARDMTRDDCCLKEVNGLILCV